MNTKALNILLQNIGFSEKEATVYLANLETGLATAATVGEKAKMNRVTAYGILLKLLEKDRVQVVERGGVQHFSALEPTLLLERTEKNTESLKHATPFLHGLCGTSLSRPNVRFLEGLEGLKKGYAETLKSKSEILSIANSQNIRKHWENYDEEYVKKRAEKKIFLRGIAPKDLAGKKVHHEDEKYFREIRLLSSRLFPTENVENEINIFDNTLLIASFSPDMFAILIESPTVAATQRQIFEILWKVGDEEGTR